MQYVIKGDYPNKEDCLIYVIGHCKKEQAYKILNRITSSPTSNDKKIIANANNLRVAEVDESDCWWNGNCD